jgi:serine/threonine protein phosphatase PrpC
VVFTDNIEFMIELGHISHVGNKRTLNEDSYDIDLPNRIALIVDGMGGVDAGDIASAMVREQLYKNIRQGDELITALKNTGQALRIQRPQQGINPSGASALAMTWHEHTFQIAWIGACQAFFFNGSETRNLNDKPIESTSAKKNTSVSTNPIQALGVTPTEKLHLHSISGQWNKHQSLLLCTDGLLDECNTTLIHTQLSKTEISAQEVIDQLLFHALQGKADNNITAILLRLH